MRKIIKFLYTPCMWKTWVVYRYIYVYSSIFS